MSFLPLSEHAKLLKDDLEAGIVWSFLDAFPWMDLFQVKNIKGRSTSFTRVETLGAVGKRSINEEYEESHATTSRHTATIELLGKYVRIDKELLDEPTYHDEAALQIQASSKAIGFQMADDIVNGDPASDSEEIAGLKVLSASLASRQVITLGGLDLTTEAQREANAGAAIRNLMLGIQRVKSGTGKKPSFILMNDTLEQYIVDALRVGGFMSLTDDTFNRDMATGTMWRFAGVPVYDAGYLSDSSTKVITDNHDGDGYTSAYIVYSSDATTRLIQKFPLRTSPRTLMQNQIHYQWLVETSLGVEMRDKFSVVRVKGWDVTA